MLNMLAEVGLETARMAALGLSGYGVYRCCKELLPEKPQTLKDRCCHSFFSGMTRSGKTELMKFKFIKACSEGHAVILLETHGDLAEEVIPLIPDDRWNDVIIIEPWKEWLVPFNFLRLWNRTHEEQNHRVEGLIDIFLHLWGSYYFGPRSQDLIRCCAYAITDLQEEVSLLELYLMLRHPDYVQSVLPRIHHDISRDFFELDWPSIEGKHDVIGPPLNKLRRLLSGPKESFCYLGKENLNLREAMNSKKVIIINLSEGKLTRPISHLLANLLLSELRIATMSRANIQPEQRPELFCEIFMDEVPSWCASNSALAQLLSEGGKYYVALNIVCQYLTQFDTDNQQAITNNISNLYLLRSRQSTLTPMKDLIEPFKPEELGKMANYQMVKRIMIDGKLQKPVKLKTPPPLSCHYSTTELKERARAVRRRAERFTVKRDIIMKSIKERLRGEPLEVPMEEYGRVMF